MPALPPSTCCETKCDVISALFEIAILALSFRFCGSISSAYSDEPSEPSRSVAAFARQNKIFHTVMIIDFYTLFLRMSYLAPPCQVSSQRRKVWLFPANIALSGWCWLAADANICQSRLNVAANVGTMWFCTKVQPLPKFLLQTLAFTIRPTSEPALPSNSGNIVTKYYIVWQRNAWNCV